MNQSKRTLYLVRHAKSSWKDHSLADIERPLNARGRRDAPDMGRRMADQAQLPELIISSPARRAISTARHIATALDIPSENIVTDKDLYFVGTAGMLGVLEKVNDAYHRVMLVGHNPAMTNLMNRLTRAHVDNMPTCAVAIIGFDMDSWGLVQSVDGQLLGYDYPKGPGRFSV